MRGGGYDADFSAFPRLRRLWASGSLSYSKVDIKPYSADGMLAQIDEQKPGALHIAKARGAC